MTTETKSRNELEMLFQSESFVLNQINKNINETNQNIEKLIIKEGLAPFYQAIRMDDEGNYRMQPGYNGYYKNFLMVHEQRIKSLLVQRREKIEEINMYQSALMQQGSYSNMEEQTRGYVDLPRGVQTSNAYTTVGMQNYGQQPNPQINNQSIPNLQENENTQGKTL